MHCALQLNCPPRINHADDPNPEAELLSACHAGQEGAYAELIRRYRHQVVNLCHQILNDADGAEDAAQETFLRVFANLSRFRGEASFKTWLYRIAINTCRGRLRTSARRGEVVCETVDSPPTGETVSQAETRWLVEAALRELPEPLRVALTLRELHGLDYREIAQTLRIPVGTVRSRLHLARRAFIAAWDRLERIGSEGSP